MTALLTKRVGKLQIIKLVELTLAAGNKGFHNGRACLRSDGKVVPASSAPGLLPIGFFLTNPADSVDATSADQTVTVDLETERECQWWANDAGGSPAAVTDVGKICYMLDDQTVTMNPTGRSSVGRVWNISTIKGVLVEKLEPHNAVRGQFTLPAYVANDSAPVSIENGGIYDVPVTTANSTITLPAAAADGTIAYFHADGTKNGHTIAYRDATGPVTLNTATTASKRHVAIAVKNGGKWAVTVTVAP